VFFRSTLFENKEPKPHFINPRCFGDDLALWLLERLRENKWSFSEPIQEDYGWGFWVEQDYWVAIGIMDDAIGIENPEWSISVNYDPGFNLRKRLFSKVDHSLHLQICEAIHAVLSSEPAITNIHWCDDAETDCGENPS
jgi:hypothetical protein